ncbi:hypothetical protein [Citricoccus muralis]|uniref:Uncharacterized protein n=1 Tax=Citricoccus muralis TaxID=169134 RepID=A0A3D9LEE8_9MICC|nr:hypothetical protein [Citricoccus muralis]REE03523.1 hypothetical protein C8E99_1336 [Citricoccus muralis]
MNRRTLLTTLAGLTAVATIGQPLPAHAARPLRVLVATNEPWGTYHLGALLDEAANAQPVDRWQIALVAPDRSNIASTDTTPVVTPEEAPDWGADLLVVNGATTWPTTVVQRLSELPVVASSLAYFNPIEEPGAATIRPRLVAMTAGSSAEAGVFAAHFGVSADRVQVVGNPGLDDMPPYGPEPATVLMATSVTHSSETGGSSPGAQVLLDSAAALAA